MMRQERTPVDPGTIKEHGIMTRITSFVPVSEYSVEIMHVEIINQGEKEVTFVPTAAPAMGKYR